MKEIKVETKKSESVKKIHLPGETPKEGSSKVSKESSRKSSVETPNENSGILKKSGSGLLNEKKPSSARSKDANVNEILNQWEDEKNTHIKIEENLEVRVTTFTKEDLVND